MQFKVIWLVCALTVSAAASAACAQADDSQAPVATAAPARTATAAVAAPQAQPGGEPDSLGFVLDDADAAPPPPDKKIHGEFGVGIGSDGYREAWGVATAPIGDHASATVAVDDGQFNWRHRNIQSRSVGVSLAFGVDNGTRPPLGVCGGPGEPLWMTMTRREQLAARDAPCP